MMRVEIICKSSSAHGCSRAPPRTPFNASYLLIQLTGNIDDHYSRSRTGQLACWAVASTLRCRNTASKPQDRTPRAGNARDKEDAHTWSPILMEALCIPDRTVNRYIRLHN